MAIVLMSECMQIIIIIIIIIIFLVKSECIPNVCCCLFCLFLVLFLERVRGVKIHSNIRWGEIRM